MSANSRLLVSDVGTMITECLAGTGIAQMISIGAKEYLDKGQLVDLFPDWPEEHFRFTPFILRAANLRQKCGRSSISPSMRSLAVAAKEVVRPLVAADRAQVVIPATERMPEVAASMPED